MEFQIWENDFNTKNIFWYMKLFSNIWNSFSVIRRSVSNIRKWISIIRKWFLIIKKI